MAATDVVSLEGERGDTASCLSYFQSLGIDPAARILDVGCRHGSFLENLRRQGYADIQGLEIDAAAIAKGEAAYPDLKGRMQVYDGTIFPFAKGSFDVITMFDVIEHIPPVEAYLTELCTLLRPGGRLVFQTPNLLVDAPYWILALRAFNREKLAMIFREHCSLQTYGSLRRLLGRAGFRDVRIERNRSDTEFKKTLVRQSLGWPGLLILQASNHFPMVLYPNFWGHARV
ncbi:class I SAM-dependent methyltransferase [Azospirillum doebereinerae]|uniref:class I SAM-dependent methyltransferase n=1 Tax=Azospirillum doebereinerae TaxID=92933 RepID=UPI001EE5E35A|nr:class I SAM-dependent methyltransferase [Azospirillum doebereinerae]MCG5238949.1 class I SAM-dependent methyltransferase [Azospirillum doebereinerae]